jgi:arsenate reductase (thioredoxin)
MPQTLLFLCPHGAAKSVIAAAYCRRLVAQHGLDLDVTSAGTEPDAAAGPAVVELLRTEGLDVAYDRPQAVSRKALAAAFRVISMGCDVGDLAPPGTIVEHWNDVPSPSQDLIAARDRIAAHVEQLIVGLMGQQAVSSTMACADVGGTAKEARMSDMRQGGFS